MMTINFRGNTPFVEINTLPTSRNRGDKKNIAYVNPNLVGIVEASSKKERLGESCTIRKNGVGNDDMNESKITMANGTQYYVDYKADELATVLSGDIPPRKLILSA